MPKSCIIFLPLLLFMSLAGHSQELDPAAILRHEVINRGQARVSIPVAGQQSLNELSRQVSVSAIRGKKAELVISANTIDWFLTSGYEYQMLEPAGSKSLKTSESISQAMEWNSYPTYTQYVEIMKGFETAYPSLCNLDTIGTSIYGKLILVLKISDNPSVNEDEPETFYSSTIHGDETGGFILMMRLADYLLKNYGSDARVTSLVNNMEIWINPLANPDGTYRTGDVISSPVRQNANGYDLNRNFPDPITPNTVKQKETLDMMSFLRERRFVLSANFHSGVEVVNYPWDRWSRRHPDDIWLEKISRKYADTVHQHAPSTYMDYRVNGVTNGYDWYFIAGGRQDYVTWELQGREVTIELDNNYVTPADNLNALWDYNWRSLLGYLENALYGIHGIVRDKMTTEPVRARISISLHDADSSHVYSDTLNGRFIRMLEPGTWDLKFSAEGYIDTEIVGIQIIDGQSTDIIVEMVPFLNPVDTVTVGEPLLYPNPASGYFKVVLPPFFNGGKVKMTILNGSGQKIREFISDAVEDIPLFIDTSSLVPGYYNLLISTYDNSRSAISSFVVAR